jgi:hypothetical protein
LTARARFREGGSNNQEESSASMPRRQPSTKPRVRRTGSTRKHKPTQRVESHAVLFAFGKPGSEQISATVREAIRATLTVKLDGAWPTLEECIPRGSILEDIRAAFEETTDIPSEIPVFATLHYLSALLLQRGARIAFAGERVKPDIWSICLAESGAGKTYAQSKVAEALGENVKLFGDFASSAKFMEELRDNNKGLWLRDEFAQFLRSVEQQPHMQEAKDYLLRCYDGQRIARRTKSDEIVVEDPALTIFGSTVFSTFRNIVTEEMLLDGFAQRFAYIVAERDPKRPETPIYRTASRTNSIREKWNAIAAKGIASEYTVNELGEKAFEEAFAVLIGRSSSAAVPRSFFRRIMFRGVKYALLYHVLLGKTARLLDAEDLGFAARVCALNLRDLRKVLDQFHMTEFQQLVNKAEAFVQRKQSEKETVTPGKLVAGVRGIGSAPHARSILEFLIEMNGALASSIDMGKAQSAPSVRQKLAVVK